MDTAGANDARDLRMHESRVATLRLRACDGTVSSTVVVQELLWEVAASHGHRRATGHIAIDEEGAILGQGAELRHDVLASRNHLRRIISRDVRGKQLGGARLL